MVKYYRNKNSSICYCNLGLFKITFIALLSIGICIIIVKYLTSYVKKSVETVHHTVDHAIDQLETIEADKLTFTDFTPLIHKTNEMTQTISSLMHIDPLTSLYNKKYLVKQVESNHYSKRHQSIILIDIDHFNKINERYGTNVGDDVLRSIANLLKQIVDTSGIIGRYSGQQFLVVLPNTSKEKAKSIAEVIAKRLFTYNFTSINERITISGSVIWDDYTDISETFEKLEAIVYKAKKLGRNQILTN